MPARLLEVLDEAARPEVEQATADEIFLAARPVLMVVEPESLCWLTGRMVKARDGVTWAEEFARFPALEAVVRDDGTGLGKGVKLERARRRAAGLPDLDDTLDVFHTLREGGRALRTTWGAASRALERADAAQKGFDRRGRQGQSRQGHGAPLNRLVAPGRAALGSGHGRRDGLEAGPVGVRVLHPRRPPQRPGPGRGGRRGGAAAPERRGVGQDPAAVAPAGELHVPGSGRTSGWPGWGWTPTSCRRCWTWKGCVASPGGCRPPTRAWALVRTVQLTKACPDWRDEAGRVRAVLRGVWRASSLVECVNSVARMQQARHRKMTQGLLDLKRLPRNSPTAGASGQCR